MRRFTFTQHDVSNLAENAEALFSWLKESEVQEKLKRTSVTLPAYLLLISSITTVSQATVTLDKLLPTSVCWYGGCTA